MEWREKEGKLNEAEKVEQKLKPGLKTKVKSGSAEREALCCMNMTHTHTHSFSFAADHNVATVGMNGVKKTTPVRVPTLLCHTGN